MTLPRTPAPVAPDASGAPVASVATNGIGPVPFNLIAYDEVDSTNTVARRLCAAEAADRTLVWARRQTAGRGRHRRTWISPAGNLYLSLILRPRVQAREATALTFVAAVAVADAIAALLPEGVVVSCKWPNDVLVGGCKIAGILLESATTADGGVDWVIVGIGVNVASHPPPAEIIYSATSLVAAGAGAVTPEAVLEALCRHLDHWLRVWAESGFSPLRDAWLARAHGLGLAIAVGTGSDAVRGTFRGLDDTGLLLVEADGVVHRIAAGDVLPNQPAPE